LKRGAMRLGTTWRNCVATGDGHLGGGFSAGQASRPGRPLPRWAVFPHPHPPLPEGEGGGEPPPGVGSHRGIDFRWWRMIARPGLGRPTVTNPARANVERYPVNEELAVWEASSG